MTKLAVHRWAVTTRPIAAEENKKLRRRSRASAYSLPATTFKWLGVPKGANDLIAQRPGKQRALQRCGGIEDIREMAPECLVHLNDSTRRQVIVILETPGYEIKADPQDAVPRVSGGFTLIPAVVGRVPQSSGRECRHALPGQPYQLSLVQLDQFRGHRR